MPANRTKLIGVVSAIILLCIFGCISAKTMADTFKKNSEGNAPVRRLRITIDVSRREELFAQLREFAEQHAFEILIREVEVTPERIFIEMHRDDLYISALSTSSDPTMIDIGFYETNPANPIPE